MIHPRWYGFSLRITRGVLSCIALFVAQCTTSLTGGNSSETTNVAVVSSSGLPVAFATVRLIDADNWAWCAANNRTPVVDSAVADHAGIVSFARLPDGPCNLQIDAPGFAMVVRSFSRMGKMTEPADTLRLFPCATLMGSCAPGGTGLSTVMLEGTAYAVPVGSDRSFSFDAIAPGSYALAFTSLSGGLAIASSTALAPDQTVARRDLAPSFTSLLIDDFEGGFAASALGQFTDASWYNYSDVNDGGSSTVERTLTTGAPQGVFSLAADIILRSSPAATWAGIGIPIGLKKPVWDLSAMTAISFWARGKNTMRVSIESPFVDSINSNWPDFGRVIPLDTNWQYYRIPVDSLVLPASKALTLGVTWAMASKRIYRIEFEGVLSSGTVDTILLQLDDLRLEGISAADLFRQMTGQEGP
ncbi:MAG: hypothetical protein JXA71_09780 [Chitinispirillaceae bacterium]|nr:hypothetical protein [Chitinispirillaceae bacterium]